MEDWISRLPDICIINILSSLTIKEAARTSVLSTRWRYLWPQIASLNFDRMDIVENSSHEEDSENVLKVKRLNYIDWVNKICSSIQTQRIEQFKIQICFDEDCKDDLDKWIDYAMEKKVKDLEIIIPRTSKRYILRWPTAVSSNIKHLKSLTFKGINISGELLEHFLLHCPSLEQISIGDSEYLTTLKVGVGVRLNNLKILEIIDCFNLTDLRICAPNLSKFRFDGPRSSLRNENIPRLHQIYSGGEYGDCLTWAFSAQLAKEFKETNLALIIPGEPERYVLRLRTDVSSNIKHLTSLNLKSVNISGVLLEHFLLLCPSLAQIFIEDSKYLTTLKVGVGVQLNNLQTLEIFDCFNLTDLRICAPNLSKFRYEGRQINLNIENVPSLRHLHIGRVYGDCLTWAFSALSSYLCQIRTLFLHLQLYRVHGDTLTQIQQLLKLSSLRELTVKISGPDNDGILYILSLLKASPFLEKFKLLTRLAEHKDLRDLLEEEAIELCPLEYLKVIEIVGSITDPNGLKFIRSLFRAATKLEKLVIDPVPTGSSFSRKEKRTQFVRKSVELLRPNVPEWTEFVL